MAIFRSTRQRFYLMAGLLLLLFGIAYFALAGFLKKLSTSAERVQAATLINEEIHWFGEQFWTLRFWEKAVQAQSHPEAEQQFGITLEKMRKRLDAFEPEPFTEHLTAPMLQIASLLSQYEESFNRLIQFETERRLNRTQLESTYQMLVSTILLSQDTDLLKPLLNLDRFLDRYLTIPTESEYQALRMVFTFLHTKLSQSAMMDDRVQSYVTKFQTFIEHDFALEQEIHVINNEFDEISRELMTLFLEISQTMEALSQEAIVTGEKLRGSIQRQFFISGVIAFIALLLIISFIARTIINPIRQMSNVAMQVKAGNDQARFTSREKDDIAELGFAFNDMLETIHQHRYRLETLVEERTERIIETNTQLQQEIARHKQTEIELQQAKEAADIANKAKSTFLANMSHELRTPLNAILGFTQIILSHNQSLMPEQQENLNIVYRSGEHLLTLINQVLDLSKIEAGHITLEATNFDLYHLLDTLKEMFHMRAMEKHLQLLFERSPNLPRYIRTDDVKLRQVLLNLLSNAIKFTKEGKVGLRVSELHEFDELNNSETQKLRNSETQKLLFEIEDSGPGIAPDELDTLFEAFVQTRTGQEWQGGTGLGLAISRKFVQLMGGDITVASEVGRGTVFTFHIQIETVEADTVETKRLDRQVVALEPGQPHYRMLVVDDNVTNRQLLSKLLQPLGFELREAANGQEALEIWETWMPHLIWMDIRMPVMNGYDATKEIRSAEAQKRRSAENGRENSPQSTIDNQQSTIILALTAISLEDEETTAISVGCDGFLRKPFRGADVFNLLHKHLGVQFIYEENPQPPTANRQSAIKETLTPEALTSLPADLCNDLYEAIESIDVDMTISLIDRIRQHNALLAEAVTELVNTYRFDLLQEWIEPDENNTIQEEQR